MFTDKDPSHRDKAQPENITEVSEPSRMTRRKFIRDLLVGSARVAAFLSGVRGVTHLTRQEFQIDESPENDNEIEANIRFLRDTYGFQIFTGLSPIEDITGTPSTERDLAFAIRILRREIRKYPVNFFRENRAQQIFFLDEAWSRLGQSIEAAFAMSLWSGEKIVVTTKNAHLVSPDLFAENLHHEFYHWVDWNNAGYLDAIQWAQIHECHCMPFGRNAQEVEKYGSLYGSTDPREDKAVFAGIMMMPDSHRKLLSRIEHANGETKRILQEKYDQMQSEFYRYSNGLMDTQYWRDLLAGKVTTRYFSDR